MNDVIAFVHCQAVSPLGAFTMSYPSFTSKESSVNAFVCMRSARSPLTIFKGRNPKVSISSLSFLSYAKAFDIYLYISKP